MLQGKNLNVYLFFLLRNKILIFEKNISIILKFSAQIIHIFLCIYVYTQKSIY